MAKEQQLLILQRDIALTIHTSQVVLVCNLLFRGLILGFLIALFWGFTAPQQVRESLLLGTSGLALSVVWGLIQRWPRTPELGQILMHLEIKNPTAPSSAFILNQRPDELHDVWEQPMAAALSSLRRFEIWRQLNVLNSTAIPLILLVICSQLAPGSLSANFDSARSVVASLSSGATLRVVGGSPDGSLTEPVKLSSRSPLTFELLSDNMIEVKVVIPKDATAPKVELRRTGKSEKSGEPVQSFQMTPEINSQSSTLGQTSYLLAISVSESSDLFLSTISDSNQVASIVVKALPIPTVTLRAAVSIGDSWSDDRPLPLEIEVHAAESLQIVALAITVDKKTSREVVTRIVAEDKRDLQLSHSLLLESYLESDVAEVEIIAEAADRSIPKPLIGHSEPLRLTVASAYGRYRQTLATLRELKQKIDNHLSKQELTADPALVELAEKAGRQAEQSPFFDGLDRAQMMRFEMQAKSLSETAKGDELLDLSSNLNSFLFEHEILDDRERDRDFFVALRTLAQVLEQEKSERSVSAKSVASRLISFLDERERRWKLRVERLSADSRPSTWVKVSRDRPFHQAIERATVLDGTSADTSEESLTTLSNITPQYRKWIEELEAKEDQARGQEEQKRQEGLSSARNEIRELQKRQGDISERLDKSDQKKPEDMAKVWPAARMEQNTNIQGTKSLEAKMRSLSPSASERIRAAMEAMGKTLEAGNLDTFPIAESSSDLAGRLLRQAERAAAESQSKRPQRGRRRRTAGDNYYGQSVVGGDVEIKREYQVDKRYREDILNEVRDANVDPEERKILDNYLREVVR